MPKDSKKSVKKVVEMTKKLKMEIVDEQFEILKVRFLHGTTEDMVVQARRIEGIRDKIKKIL